MTIQYNPERMSNNRLSVALCAALVICVVGGCVWPGAIDQSVVGRYQRAMAAEGPQPRGIDGLAPLIPEPATQPPLNMVTDKETGQTRVLLSLDAAILRALANNLHIRVVSFDPALSREDTIAQQVAGREMAGLRARGYTWLNANQTQTTGFAPTLNTHQQQQLEAPRTDGLSQGQRTIGKDGNLVVVTVRVNWFSTAVGREMTITREAKVAP